MHITLIKFFFLFLLITPARAQNVTTSFNRSVLATNPSAATTRGLSQFAISQTYKTVNSSLKPTDTSYDVTKFIENAKLDSTEIRLTGGHSKIVPELYIGFNKAEKESKAEGIDSSKSTNTTQFVDNFLNLGYRVSKRVGLGMRLAFPTIGFKSKRKGFTSDRTEFNYIDEYDNKITGITLGTTLLLWNHFYFGSFVNLEQSKGKSSAKFLNYDTNAEEKKNQTLNQNITRYGAGLSYLRGDSRRHGFRSEISLSQMSKPKDSESSESPSELKVAMEIAWKGVSFGGNLRTRKAGYYDQSDYIQQIFTQGPSEDTIVMSYGGFLALSSEKGHSFGLYGYILNENGDDKFQGIEGKSQSKTTLMNFNYAFLF